MTTVQSLTERVDTKLVKSGSFVIKASGGGYDIVQPGDPMFSTATMIAVAYVDSQGALMPVHPDSDDDTDESTLPRVDKIVCTKIYVDCPSCHAQQYGWINDPRGKVFECSECKLEYLIPNDVAFHI